MTEKRKDEILSVVGQFFSVKRTTDNKIALYNPSDNTNPIHTFYNWRHLEAWAVEQDWGALDESE